MQNAMNVDKLLRSSHRLWTNYWEGVTDSIIISIPTSGGGGQPWYPESARPWGSEHAYLWLYLALVLPKIFWNNFSSSCTDYLQHRVKVSIYGKGFFSGHGRQWYSRQVLHHHLCLAVLPPLEGLCLLGSQKWGLSRFRQLLKSPSDFKHGHFIPNRRQ